MAQALSEKRIARDLQKRAEKNRKIYAARREVEHARAQPGYRLGPLLRSLRRRVPRCRGRAQCRGDHAVSVGLRGMLKDRDLVEDVLYYFLLQGGECDCSVFLEVDMKDPRPLTDANCHDCGHDYDGISWSATTSGALAVCIAGCSVSAVWKVASVASCISKISKTLRRTGQARFHNRCACARG